MQENKAVLQAVEYALDKKGFNLKLLDVRELSSLTDYLLLVSGRSDRQVQAVAENIKLEFKTKHQELPLATEGMDQGQPVQQLVQFHPDADYIVCVVEDHSALYPLGFHRQPVVFHQRRMPGNRPFSNACPVPSDRGEAVNYRAIGRVETVRGATTPGGGTENVTDAIAGEVGIRNANGSGRRYRRTPGRCKLVIGASKIQ